MNNLIPMHQCCPPEAATVVTVQTVDGIKGLSNCFVRVLANNTVYYVDSKHHITQISSNIVEVEQYDVENNPSNFRGQIVYDTSTKDLIYFTYEGKGISFSGGVTQEDLDKVIADVAINTRSINTLTDEVGELQVSQADIFQSIATLGATEVQKNTAVSGDESTITISKSVGSLTGEDTDTAMPLPVASKDNAGVMNAATYKAVQTNSTDINTILNGAVAVAGIAATPTQEELTAAWKEATGLEELVNRASIYDTDNEKVWYYYTNINEWKPVTNSGSTEITVAPFTNEQAGIIKGSETDGQVFAETDGTGSVVGWDALVGRVTTLEESGSDVNILTAYSDSPAEGDVYGATYVNSRLDSAWVVLGRNATRATNGSGVVIGGLSEATSTGAIALGYGARANYTNGVAIGEYSRCGRATEVAFGRGSGTPGPKTRFLANVTAGTLPTDAVNLQQMQDYVAEHGGGSGGGEVLSEYTASPTTNDVYGATYINKRLDYTVVSIGAGAFSSGPDYVGTVRIGNQARTTGQSGVAIGYSANADTNGTAVGAQSNTNGKEGSIALGNSSVCGRKGELSIANPNASGTLPKTRYIANVKAGELDTDAVNVSQLQSATEGTVLYEGGTFTNSISLNESIYNYTRVEVIAYYTSAAGISPQFVTVYYPTAGESFTVKSEYVVENNSTVRYVDERRDRWSVADDGLSLTLLSATAATIYSDHTAFSSSTTPTTGVTKIIGYGKKEN